MGLATTVEPNTTQVPKVMNKVKNVIYVPHLQFTKVYFSLPAVPALYTRGGTQIVAEEMWNHLEMDGSIGAGGKFEAGGMLE